ncbi:hypothetical protein [Marinagarivorans algicola]|uniref:hypothetical protein n=1 Tax=Marinagarivorans algicola TaxID=1513270 RepID=UPI0006B9B88B|nr:hypothetical protein [Marinagarivorans algicola]
MRLCVGIALYLSTHIASAEFSHFISCDGHWLLNGNQEFRFAGIHTPKLYRIENDAAGTCSQDPRGWDQYFQWPTADEQENRIKALVRTGHKAMRIYVLSVVTPYDKACKRETHILPPATPNGMPRLNKKPVTSSATPARLLFSRQPWSLSTMRRSNWSSMVLTLTILPSTLDDPNIDIISNHFYTTNNNNNPEQIEHDLKATNGKKVVAI